MGMITIELRGNFDGGFFTGEKRILPNDTNGLSEPDFLVGIPVEEIIPVENVDFHFIFAVNDKAAKNAQDSF